MKFKRLRRQAASRHADDWLMTYSDMITLLLCFFVLFLAVTLAKKNPPLPAPPAPVPAVVQAAPPVKAVPESTAPQQAVEVTVAKVPFVTPLVAPLPAPAREEAPLSALSVPVQPDAPPPPPAPLADVKAAPDASLKTSVSPAPPQLAKPDEEKGAAPFEQKGDRITSLEMNSAAFFDVGSATLSETGKKILDDVAHNLKSEAFKDYQITVEGHTDDTPIKTAQFPSNWELSTARAAAVVRYFLEKGVQADRLRAAGYADTFPKAPNRDAAGNPIPANQALNRRVVIKLEKLDKE